MRQMLPEEQRLLFIQNLIDRLIYLEAEDRDTFLKKLNELYLKHPIQQHVIWGAQSYQNEYSNNTINLSDDDREHGDKLS